jgi:hypothetical protein
MAHEQRGPGCTGVRGLCLKSGRADAVLCGALRKERKPQEEPSPSQSSSTYCTELLALLLTDSLEPLPAPLVVPYEALAQQSANRH